MPGRRVLTGFAAALTALLAFPFLATAKDEAPAPPPKPPRVGILVLSPDRLTAGRLQLDLEKRLAEVPGVELVTARDSAFRVGKETDGGPPGRTDDREILDLLEGAREDYFEDELVRAIRQLDRVADIFAKQRRVAVDDRVDLHLWRAAVHLGLGELGRAEEEALAALTLTPGLEIDRSVFPPSVERLFSTVRDGLKMAVVKVRTYPPGAWVEVDDRQVQPDFSLPAGRHRLVVSAPGFHPVEKTIKLERYLEVMVGLPVALDARFEKTIGPAVIDGDPDLPARTLLAYVAGRLDAQGLVIISAKSAKGERRGFVWWEGAKGRASPRVESEMGEVILQNWSVTMLEDFTKRRPDLQESIWDGWSGRLRIGAVLATRRRQLSSEGGGFSATFVGSGPRIDMEGGRDGFIGELSYEYFDSTFSRTTQVLGDGSVGIAHGGTTSFFRIAGGYRLDWPQPRDADFSLGGTIGFFFNEHFAQDVRTANGPSGYFTSYRWLGPELWLSGSWAMPVRFWGEPALRGGVGVAPVSLWRERPPRTTGFSPAVEPAWSWRVEAVVTPRNRWEVSLDYSGRWHKVRLSGEVQTTIDPAVPIRSARITEEVHLVTLSVHRLF